MKVVNLSVATSERWKDRMSGEPRERTEWHRVVIFNENLARVAEQYLRKGSSVYLEGQLQTRKWTDQQGVEKYTTEVVLGRFRGELTLLGGRGDGAGAGGGYGDSSGGGFGCGAISNSARTLRDAPCFSGSPHPRHRFRVRRCAGDALAAAAGRDAIPGHVPHRLDIE